MPSDGLIVQKRRRLTAKQKAWVKGYESYFGMDAMYIEDYLTGEHTWAEVCQFNYTWLENFYGDGIRSLERLQ